MSQTQNFLDIRASIFEFSYLILVPMLCVGTMLCFGTAGPGASPAERRENGVPTQSAGTRRGAERRDEKGSRAQGREGEQSAGASPRRAQGREGGAACSTISPTCSAFGTPAILHIDRENPHHKKPPKEISGSFF